MDGRRIKINKNTYQNDMNIFRGKDDVLIMLVHLGYLAYDEDTDQVYIPNKEIENELIKITNEPLWNTIAKKVERFQQLLRAIWQSDEEKDKNLIEEYYVMTDKKSYSSENTLKYSILQAFYAAEEYYNECLELDSGSGYVDIAYIPINAYSKHPALLIKLKCDKDVDTTIEQLMTKKYYEKIKQYKDNMMFIEINYSQDVNNENGNYRYHSCKIKKNF